MKADLPIDPGWHRADRLDPKLWVITEPRVHPVLSANIHLVLGRDADLLIDSGMGIAPLRPFVDKLRPDSEKPLICLSTHTHVDHIGAVHEFEQRLVHPIEADALANPEPFSLRSKDMSDAFRAIFEEVGYASLWQFQIDAVPNAEFNIDAYRLKGAPATGLVRDGDTIDLGDWQAEVLHLPGHSPGQVGLFHHDSGSLFGADAIYDGPLIYKGPGMSVPDYASTLRRLHALPVSTVHGGHDPCFGKPRLNEIVDAYLRLWNA